MTHQFPLQPLSIPAGWLVEYNDGLYEVDPNLEGIPESDRCWIFKEDMLQMRHISANLLLDVGWYPAGDLVLGSYTLVVHKGDFHGKELHRFSTRDRLALVEEIERILVGIAMRKL